MQISPRTKNDIMPMIGRWGWGALAASLALVAVTALANTREIDLGSAQYLAEPLAGDRLTVDLDRFEPSIAEQGFGHTYGIVRVQRTDDGAVTLNLPKKGWGNVAKLAEEAGSAAKSDDYYVGVVVKSTTELQTLYQAGAITKVDRDPQKAVTEQPPLPIAAPPPTPMQS